MALEAHITACAGGDCVGGSAAQDGFKARNTAGAGSCAGGQIHRDGTAVAAVIEGVGAGSANERRDTKSAGLEDNAVVTTAQIQDAAGGTELGT